MPQAAKIPKLTVPTQVAGAVDKFLANKPDGERFGVIVQHVVSKKITTESYAYVAVSELPNKHPDKYFRPKWGYMCLCSAVGSSPKKKAAKKIVLDETLFYDSFAGFLQGEIEPDCVAVKYGRGARGEGRGTWRTPDVVGLSKLPPNIRMFSFTPEIVSAEIKTATDEVSVISGFGQACAYKVFSHKSYLVVPKQSDHIDRLVALCDIFGIGLVLFTLNEDKPDFDIRARAVSHRPNAFYVVKFFEGMDPTVRKAIGVEREERLCY